MNDIMKTSKTVDDSNVLMKVITKTIETETKEKGAEFLGKLLGTLGASLLDDMLAGKGMVATSHGCGMMRAGFGNKKMDF